MNSINLRSLRCACLLGAINGLLFGAVFQLVSKIYFEFDYRRMAVEFNGVPPSMMRALEPSAEYLLWILLFTLASFIVHRLWSKRVKSSIVLWQIISIVAIVAPFTLWYVYNRITRWVEAIQWRLEQGTWGYLPSFGQNVEFELLLLCVAISINLAYGAIIQKLAERCMK